MTSIITRQKEFAMLQSIGMTGKQLKQMLSYEGLYYAAGTIIALINSRGTVLSPCCADSSKQFLVFHVPFCNLAYAGCLSVSYSFDSDYSYNSLSAVYKRSIIERLHQKTDLIYAFGLLKSPTFQGFPCMVGGQTGQFRSRGRAFLIVCTPLYCVETLLVSWRLPPRAAALTSVMGVVTYDGIRNGGLDVLKTAAVPENPLWRMKLPALQRFFLFPSGRAD